MPWNSRGRGPALMTSVRAPEPLREKLRGDLHAAEAYYRRQHHDRGDLPGENATAEMAAGWRIDAESFSANSASTKGWQSADDGAGRDLYSGVPHQRPLLRRSLPG